MRRRFIAAIALLALFGLVIFGLWPSKSVRSRDLQCATVSDARAAAICRRLEKELEWMWLGHAIVSPGWRIGFNGVRGTYCAEKITVDDLPALELLRRSTPDWRAESGAENLIRLLRNKDGAGDEPITSIFNPENPTFILKIGCNS